MILKLAIKHIPMYQSKIAKISNTFWASPQKQNFKNLCMSSAKWYLQPSRTAASPESCWLAGDICITFAVVWQQGLTHIWTHSDISTNLHFPRKPRSPWLGHPCPVRNKPIFPTLFWHGWSSSSLLINTRGKNRKCDKTHQWPLSVCAHVAPSLRADPGHSSALLHVFSSGSISFFLPWIYSDSKLQIHQNCHGPFAGWEDIVGPISVGVTNNYLPRNDPN